MATSAKKKKDDSFDETIFKFLFNNRYDPDAIGYEGRYNPRSYPEIYEGLEGVNEYDEFRNTLINKMLKSGDNSILAPAVTTYNDLFGDKLKGVNYDMKMLSSPKHLEKQKRELGYKNTDSSLLANKMAEVSDAAGISAGELIDAIKMGQLGFGDDEESMKKFRTLFQESFKDPKQRRQFYRNLGYVMPEQGDDYALGQLYELAKRVELMKRFNDVGKGTDLATSFVAPYSYDELKQGKEPLPYEFIMDAATLYPAAKGATAAKLPQFVQKIPGLKKFADIELDNALAKIGLGAFSGAGFDIVDHALDSLFTNHVYSNVPGYEDSERGDVLDALFSADPTKVAAAGLTSAIIGHNHAKAASNAEKRAVKKERDALNKERESYLSEDNKLDVSKEAFEKDVSRLKEIEREAAEKNDKSILDKLFYAALIKGSIGTPATQMLLQFASPFFRKNVNTGD